MRSDWTPKPGDRVVRLPRHTEIGPVTFTMPAIKPPHRAMSSSLIVIYAFVGLIGLGTLILLLPFTNHGDGFTPFMDALFTTTSAVTVTGLTVQNTASYWTTGGQIVLAAMIFIGGLGFMSLATFALVIAGQRVTLSQRILIRESMGGDLLGMEHGSIVRLTMGIVLFAAGAQLLAFVVLAIRFWALYPPDEALLNAMFHAVSAFNNAGFIFFDGKDGLAIFQQDWTIIGMTGLMIFLGSISYGVMFDIVWHRRFRLFGLTTKLVLLFTLLTILLGIGTFLVFEYRNPQTLGDLPVNQKLTTAAFEAVSAKTAGFSTLDYSETAQETNFMITGLMFVGGASASVAGGIKVNTLAVILIAVFATLRGRSNATAFRREIPAEQVRWALVLGTISAGIVFTIVVALNISDGTLDFLALFFESVSAFGTVGLSTGITSLLSPAGQMILIVAMFIGRIGPFSIGIAMAERSSVDSYRFASERVTIG